MMYVNHPRHYMGDNGLEAIDVIEAFTSDMVGIEASCTANILKYACRWKKKGGIQDLEKLVWYANYLIEHLKKDKRTELEKVQESFDKDMIVIEDVEVAVNMLNFLKKTILRNGYATINDFLNYLVWCPSRPNKEVYSEYGWTNLDAAPIIKVSKDKEAYVIGVPKIERIKE